MQYAGGMLLVAGLDGGHTTITLPFGKCNVNEPRHPLHKRPFPKGSGLFLYIYNGNARYNILLYQASILLIHPCQGILC